ncbi:MAG: hypothetical protein RJA49_2767 [Actinomycetota bacterium]|jgi:hypothetical protein
MIPATPTPPPCTELGHPIVLGTGWCGEPPEWTEPVPTTPTTTVASGVTGYVIPATTAPATARRVIVRVQHGHVADVLLVRGPR